MSTKNTKLTMNVVLNMLIATFGATFFGILLDIFNIPSRLVCGMVAMGAVLAEHYLTLHPINAADRVKKFCKIIKEKVSSLWKN